ncbi:pyridoxal phosphate-dependent aminotransferase [Candidatus Uhrbacteria bacterium]|nr:pyridoxal phosphate-dependent aminotransferase [Candidatus Uhrbacteria bacterium]
MPRLQISRRGQSVIASPIRKFLPLLQAAQKRGVEVYKLNTGDPDIAVPPLFFKTLKQYNSPNLPYAPTPGFPSHVNAWIQYYKQFGVRLEPNNIIPTVGCAEAILLALMAVADDGDEILVFEPLYVSYKSFSVMIGVKLVPIPLSAENNFALPSMNVLQAKVTAKTKAIVVINPDNPTGKLWSDEELSHVVRFAKINNLFVVADETYREIRFVGKASCLLADSESHNNTIVIDSVSKRFSMPGARVGCVVSYNEEVMGAVLKFAQARLSVGTLEQFALDSLIKQSKKITAPIRKEYQARRDIVYSALSAMPGVTCSKPDGAFYIIAKLPVESAEEFVKWLIRDFTYKNHSVMVSPIADFYITPGRGKDEIRIAYVLKIPLLKKAMEVLSKGLEAYGHRK